MSLCEEVSSPFAPLESKGNTSCPVPLSSSDGLITFSLAPDSGARRFPLFFGQKIPRSIILPFPTLLPPPSSINTLAHTLVISLLTSTFTQDVRTTFFSYSRIGGFPVSYSTTSSRNPIETKTILTRFSAD